MKEHDGTHIISSGDTVRLKEGVKVQVYHPPESGWIGTVQMVTFNPNSTPMITCNVMFKNGVYLRDINADHLIVLDNDPTTPDTD